MYAGEYGFKIKIILQVFGISQQDLAVKLGTTTTTVSRWKNGHSYPIRAFQTKIDDLYDSLPGR